MVIQHYLLIKRKLRYDQKARGEYQSSISHQLRKHIFAFLFSYRLPSENDNKKAMIAVTSYQGK